MKLKKILSLIPAAAICLSLTACAGEITSSANETPDAAKAEETVITLTESWDFSLGFYPVITSAISSNFGIMYWGRNFYNTLVSYDDNGKIQGELAESWDISNDGLTYTFFLRDGVKFSDGTALTASAVKTSFEAAIEKLGVYNGSYGKLTTIIASMEAPDDKTFVMTLTQPYYGALNDLTMCNPMAVLNTDVFSGDPYTTCAEQTMGTGPYMYAGDFDGTTYTFVRNPFYWGEAPEVDSFKIKVIEDNDAKVLALRSGEIDAIIGSARLGYDAYSELAQDDTYITAVNDNGNQTRYIGFNLSAEPFSDILVRQAVAYALDNETLCASVFQGIEKPAETLFEADKPYCDVAQTTYSYELDKAKALMDEAGWVDSDGDGVREKNDRTLELTMTYMQGLASLDDAVLTIADQLTEIGFKITPSGSDMMTWLGAITAGEYQITMYQTYGGAYDPSTVMTNMNPDTSADPVAMQFAPAMENGSALLTELNSTGDLERVQEIYAEVLGMIAEKALMVPVSHTREFAAWSSETMTEYDFFFDSQYVNIAGIHLT